MHQVPFWRQALVQTFFDFFWRTRERRYIMQRNGILGRYNGHMHK